MKAVIHLHSRHSYDSYSSPRAIVNHAVKNNIDVLCITDHNTIKGSLEAYRYACSRFPGKIKILIGAEYYTDCGDIIALNIQNEISFQNAFDLIEKVHLEGGYILFPHPYKYHTEIEKLAPHCDAIEVFNARCSEAENALAMELALKYSKPQYVASDAHFLAQSFDCINYSESEQEDSLEKILMSIRLNSSMTKYTAKSHVQLSQAIKGIKTRNGQLLMHALIQYGKLKVKEILS